MAVPLVARRLHTVATLGSGIHTNARSGCISGMRLLLVAFIGVGLLASHSAVAQNRGVRIVGAAIGLCGDWTEARREAKPEHLTRSTPSEQWALGFLAGWAGGTREDILFGLTSAGVLGWIDNYCSAHPLDLLTQALVELGRVVN